MQPRGHVVVGRDGAAEDAVDVGGDVGRKGVTGTVLGGEAQDRGRLGLVLVSKPRKGKLASGGVLDHLGSCLDIFRLAGTGGAAARTDSWPRCGHGPSSRTSPGRHAERRLAILARCL